MWLVCVSGPCHPPVGRAGVVLSISAVSAAGSPSWKRQKQEAGQVCFALRSPAKRCRSNSHYLAGCFHSSGGRNARKRMTMARLETGKKACAVLFNHRRFIRGRKKTHTVLPLAWKYRSICWLQSTCRLWKLTPFPLFTGAAFHLSYLLSLDTIERKES